MTFQHIKDYPELELWSGTVLQFPGKPHYEDLVEVLIVDSPSSNIGLILVISSGAKAGSILLDPPVESKSESGIAISKEWLIKNWRKWVYPDCDSEAVKIRRNYEAK